jgi:hypothetical protein
MTGPIPQPESDLQNQERRVFRNARINLHSAIRRGELDGIVDQNDKNLPDTRWVRAHWRQPAVHIGRERDLLGGGRPMKRVDGVNDCVGQRSTLQLDRQLASLRASDFE